MAKKKYPKNFGLVEDTRHPDLKAKDFIFGGISGITNEIVLMPQGHGWKPFLPPLEVQTGVSFDTYACVTYSAIACILTLINKKYGVLGDKSERFTAKMSGTKPGYGNSLYNVAESIRKVNGMVDQSVWPFPRTDPNFTVNDFYETIPLVIQQTGLQLFKQYTIQYEFVNPTPQDMMSALQYAPLQVTGYAWNEPINGVYQRTNETPNHAFKVYDYVENVSWEIYDQYDNDFKTLAWDYLFGSALKFDVTLAQQTNMTFLQSLLARGIKYIQRSQAQGQVYRLDQTGITFLDTKPDTTGHTPIYDDFVKELNSEGKLTGIGESDYQKLLTP